MRPVIDALADRRSDRNEHPKPSWPGYHWAATPRSGRLALLTAQGLESLRALALGRGYAEQFPGSRGVRDVEHGVPIDVLIAGEYPGDGRPKPVKFPDPAEVAVRGVRAALLPLPRLVELKLAAGISAPHRLRDLADVLELIRAADLPAELVDELDSFVREKYLELWRAAQTPDPH